jgi:hypothetical protein
MPNAWLDHVSQFRKKNSALSYKDLLQQARKSYKGGAVEPYVESGGVARYASTVGGRRRRSRQTRRKSRRSRR